MYIPKAVTVRRMQLGPNKSSQYQLQLLKESADPAEEEPSGGGLGAAATKQTPMEEGAARRGLGEGQH